MWSPWTAALSPGFGGEIFGILVPNGAGKTTTVECIAGLTVRRPDQRRRHRIRTSQIWKLKPADVVGLNNDLLVGPAGIEPTTSTV
jgi:translation initiation factor RLI1